MEIENTVIGNTVIGYANVGNIHKFHYDERVYRRPSHYRGRFHIIEESIKKIKKAFKNPFDYPEFHGFMYHENKLTKNKNKRKKRSTRREGELVLLLPAIIDTVNLCNMQLGYFMPTGKFINFNYAKLEELTGLTTISVKRHMKELQNLGIIDVKKISRTLPDGKIYHERTVITLFDKIFQTFDLMKELNEDRERARKNREKIEKQLMIAKFPKKAREEKDARRHISDVTSMLSGKFNINNKTKEVTQYHRNSSIPNVPFKRVVKDEYNPLHDKRVLDAIGMIMKADPSIGIKRALEMVQNRIKSPPH